MQVAIWRLTSALAPPLPNLIGPPTCGQTGCPIRFQESASDDTLAGRRGWWMQRKRSICCWSTIFERVLCCLTGKNCEPRLMFVTLTTREWEGWEDSTPTWKTSNFWAGHCYFLPLSQWLKFVLWWTQTGEQGQTCSSSSSNNNTTHNNTNNNTQWHSGRSCFYFCCNFFAGSSCDAEIITALLCSCSLLWPVRWVRECVSV